MARSSASKMGFTGIFWDEIYLPAGRTLARLANQQRLS